MSIAATRTSSHRSSSAARSSSRPTRRMRRRLRAGRLPVAGAEEALAPCRVERLDDPVAAGGACRLHHAQHAMRQRMCRDHGVPAFWRDRGRHVVVVADLEAEGPPPDVEVARRCDLHQPRVGDPRPRAARVDVDLDRECHGRTVDPPAAGRPLVEEVGHLGEAADAVDAAGDVGEVVVAGGADLCVRRAARGVVGGEEGSRLGG